MFHLGLKNAVGSVVVGAGGDVCCCWVGGSGREMCSIQEWCERLDKKASKKWRFEMLWIGLRPVSYIWLQKCSVECRQNTNVRI